MSKIYIPFIYHDTINHKFFSYMKDKSGVENHTLYWSGIYPRVEIDKRNIASQFVDKLLNYDTCILTIDDYLFLIDIIGFDVVNSLMQDNAIEIKNNHGLKTAIYSYSENKPFALQFSYNKEFDPEKYLMNYQRIYHTELPIG